MGSYVEAGRFVKALRGSPYKGGSYVEVRKGPTPHGDSYVEALVWRPLCESVVEGPACGAFTKGPPHKGLHISMCESSRSPLFLFPGCSRFLRRYSVRCLSQRRPRLSPAHGPSTD